MSMSFQIGVLATMGTSPPIITEFLQYLELKGIVPHNIILISTRDKTVRESTLFARAAIRNRYRKTRVSIREVDVEDVDTEEKLFKFLEDATEVMWRARVNNHILYVNIAGGRMTMAMSVALLAQMIGVNGVYHVIMPDVKTFNIKLERIRKEIEDLAKLKDEKEQVEFYAKNKKIFDDVMFPPPSEYNVIRLPLLPMPRDVLVKIARMLSDVKAKIDPALPKDILEHLEMSGIIKRAKDLAYVTEFGRKIGAILKSVLMI